MDNNYEKINKKDRVGNNNYMIIKRIYLKEGWKQWRGNISINNNNLLLRENVKKVGHKLKEKI